MIKRTNYPCINLFFLLFYPLHGIAATDSFNKNDRKAKAVVFNRGFMGLVNSNIDLSSYENSDNLQPGVYMVDVIVNERKRGTFNVKVVNIPGREGIYPVFDYKTILTFGIDTQGLPENWKEEPDIFIDRLIDGATSEYIFEDEVVNITIPQVYLLNMPDGYVNPELWDDGLPVLKLNYDINTNMYKQREQSENRDYYANLTSTFSWDKWRFNSYDTWSARDGGDKELSHIYAYAQRRIVPLKAQLTIGDWNTNGVLFNSVPIRGISLASDDRMLPYSLRGFAPIVRGTAQTNARVSIRQNSNLLYETTVSTGEFAIKDLPAAGYGGDLEVTVKETDGSTQVYTVPYSSIVELLRPRMSKFTVSLGELRSEMLREINRPALMEGSWQYGLNNYMTIYGGMQVTSPNNYMALMAGTAINTPLGALGLDVTRSFTSFDNYNQGDCNSLCNISFKISLAKYFNETDTNITLANYRYSSRKYHTLMETLQIKEAEKQNDVDMLPETYRNRYELNISQRLPYSWGDFFISGMYGNSWSKIGFEDSKGRDSGSEMTYQIGYNNNFGYINYSLSASRVRYNYGSDETRYNLNFSVPLGEIGHKRPRLSSAFSYSGRDIQNRLSLSGTVGDYSQMSYGGYFNYGNRDQLNAGMNLGYISSTAYGSMSLSQTKNSWANSVGLGGGVVIHPGGINLTSSKSETYAIVHAPGAQGAGIYPDLKSKIASNGYGLVGTLSPYQYNEIYLDPIGAPVGLVLDESRTLVVPTAGAAIEVNFTSSVKQTALYRLKDSTGRYIPFGASVYSTKGVEVGVVGQGGVVVISGLEKNKQLTAKWNVQEKQKQCHFIFDANNISVDDINNSVCR